MDVIQEFFSGDSDARVSWSLAGVIILVIFNSIWAGHCLTQIWYQWETWTFFGINHLALEAAYVSFLAFVECRYVLLRD